jgi:hypothetical protein
MKHSIEDLVDTCPGVQDIDNRLRVQSREQAWGSSSDTRSSSAGSTGTGSMTTGDAGNQLTSGSTGLTGSSATGGTGTISSSLQGNGNPTTGSNNRTKKDS